MGAYILRVRRAGLMGAYILRIRRAGLMGHFSSLDTMFSIFKAERRGEKYGSCRLAVLIQLTKSGR